MPQILITVERNKELRSSIKYAIDHGNGQIAISAKELLSLLPDLPSDNAQTAPTLETAELPPEPVQSVGGVQKPITQESPVGQAPALTEVKQEEPTSADPAKKPTVN